MITVLPNEIEYVDENYEYLFCTCQKISSLVDEVAVFDKSIYKRLCEVLQKVSEIKPSFIYLSDTMAIWLDQSSGSNREENGKAEINPCFIVCKRLD